MKRILMLAVVPVLMLVGSVRANDLSIAPEMLTEAKAVSHVAAPSTDVAENAIELGSTDGKSTDACYYGGYGWGSYCGSYCYPSYSWCYPVYRCYTSYYCYPYSCFNYYCGHWCY